mmetsp:Transcript_115865/g.275342  ORF Transcript_115865/g.275342 Transcript_115865/m.275342 type:complete len:152 (-) Transcript_115865:69-524(-)
MIPEWEGEGDAHDIWSTRERADTAEIASQSERSRETKARSPSSDCAGCNVAQDDVAANLAEAHKDEGQELHGMLAKHGKLLTEALEAVQAFTQSAATKSPGKASRLTSVMLQLQRANVDVLSALLQENSQLTPEPEPALKKPADSAVIDVQ